LGDHASREKALEHYNKCFSVRYDGFYTMNYGKALLLMGHVKEAEEIFWRGINEPLRALDGTPVHQDYLYNALGELYIAQQKWEKARECFKGAALYLMSPYKLPENFLLTLNPTFKNLRLYTIVNENTTNFKSKLLKIDELLSNNYPERELSEGQLMFRNHNVSNALNWYADALLKYPGHKILMFETAILFYINKKFDDALYLLCNFIKLEKFHSDAYSLMGSMLQEQKRTTDALVMANLLNNLKDYEKNIAILEAARLEANRH
jgi:predicted Zn-dependent protease